MKKMCLLVLTLFGLHANATDVKINSLEISWKIRSTDKSPQIAQNCGLFLNNVAGNEAVAVGNLIGRNKSEKVIFSIPIQAKLDSYGVTVICAVIFNDKTSLYNWNEKTLADVFSLYQGGKIAVNTILFDMIAGGLPRVAVAMNEHKIIMADVKGAIGAGVDISRMFFQILPLEFAGQSQEDIQLNRKMYEFINSARLIKE